MRLTRYEEITQYLYRVHLRRVQEHLHIVGLRYAAVRGIDHVHPRIFFDEMPPRGDIDV